MQKLDGILDMKARVRARGGHIESISMLALRAWLLRSEGHSLVVIDPELDRKWNLLYSLMWQLATRRPPAVAADDPAFGCDVSVVSSLEKHKIGRALSGPGADAPRRVVFFNMATAIELADVLKRVPNTARWICDSRSASGELDLVRWTGICTRAALRTEGMSHFQDARHIWEKTIRVSPTSDARNEDPDPVSLPVTTTESRRDDDVFGKLDAKTICLDAKPHQVSIVVDGAESRFSDARALGWKDNAYELAAKRHDSRLSIRRQEEKKMLELFSEFRRQCLTWTFAAGIAASMGGAG